MEKITQGISDLSMTPVSMAQKIGAGAKPDGRNSVPVALVANMYPLKMAQLPVYRYDVDMLMKFGSKLVSLVKKTIDDYVAIDNKDKCRATFRLGVRRFGQTFFNPRGIFYDLQSVLYSVDKLKDEAGKELTGLKELVIPGEDLKDVPEFKGRTVDSVILHVKPVDSNFQLALGDLSYVDQGIEANMNHDLIQFLELATSQHAYLTATEFVTYPSGVSYMCKPVKDLQGGKHLLNGVQKSVKVIQGKTNDKASVAVVVDPKKTAFHKAGMRVVDKVYELGLMNDDGSVHPSKISDIDKQLKHLYVETRHGKNVRRFDVTGCDPKSARQMRFESPDGEITVEQYIKKRYGLILEYADAPLAVARGRKTVGEKGSTSQKVYFPMELLYVCPNQRVTNTQQTPKQISEMIRSCAVLPSDRAQEIQRNVAALRLTGGNSSMSAAQLHVDKDMMRLDGRALAPPEVLYKNSKKFTVDPNTGKWKASGPQKPQFLIGASIKKWGIFLIAGGKPYPNDERVVKGFSELMLTECKQRGMVVSPPQVFQAIPGRVDEIEKIFKLAKNDGFEFLFFVQESRLSLHKEIKHYERKYEIITQDLNMNTCKSVVEQRKMLSLENIINKTNVKMGGVNYSLVVNAPGTQHLFGKGRLYIGFQVSHAAPLSPEEIAMGVVPRQPTVIGAAGNITKEPAAFVGDIMFQTPRSDDMEIAMKKLVKEFAERYKAAVGCPPSEVVIYRNGASEGQFVNLLRAEVPAIRTALKEAGAGTAKLTLMVVSKLHNVRLMPSAMRPGGKAPEQNVKPGTVVDTTIVHPSFAEFYLNSHQTLQGSAKTPKYTVMVDDSQFQMSYLELMTYVLSYGHQIVGLPTSLPTPAYVAGRYAERGAMLLQAAKQETDVSNFEKLSQELSYGTSKIGDKRINA
ncbi:hypothetical protein QR680_004945 [Steinernema hermaphroditum]|uniref:Piwi domain-containing protein n=1 Tax=Steinernema hermaphroditum TaxID=289476 RepID=A0AA39LUH7_9BILA|nr:hypothetical protein QR680_004945 [Steinernema hermaphroditum]